MVSQVLTVSQTDPKQGKYPPPLMISTMLLKCRKHMQTQKMDVNAENTWKTENNANAENIFPHRYYA